MNEYENSRKLAIEAIQKALDAHENQDFFSIGKYLDEYEVLLYKLEIEQGTLLLVAHEFLTGWSDSAAHDWYHWEPLKQEDWPRLAKIILQDLRANREVTDPEILSEFRYISEPKRSFISRICDIFSGKKT